MTFSILDIHNLAGSPPMLERFRLIAEDALPPDGVWRVTNLHIETGGGKDSATGTPEDALRYLRTFHPRQVLRLLAVVEAAARLVADPPHLVDTDDKSLWINWQELRQELAALKAAKDA